MSSPSYLYILGNEGGPYKVGFSSDPRARAWAIVRTWPGSLYATKRAALLHLIRLPDREAAEGAEARARAMLAAHRVPRLNTNGRPISSTEWFTADLETVLTAMAEAVADIPDAEVCETAPPARHTAVRMS